MVRSADNVIPFPAEPAIDIEAAAAAWLARLTSGTASMADLAEFAFWRGASLEHGRVYDEMQAMWDGMVRAERPTAPGRRESIMTWGANRMRGWTIHLGQLAAAVLLLAMTTPFVLATRHDLHTGAGEIRTVTLADGSTVSMKGGTAIDVAITPKGPRHIVLARGEAFFNVRHDPSRPFTVSVGGGVVRDIGTGFAVARDGHLTTVTVEHGAVGVSAVGLSDVLHAGDQISFSLYEMSRRRRADVKSISAWRRGLYFAEAKPLGEVLSDLQEYRSGYIFMASRALAARRVNAVVHVRHVDALLDALDQTPGVSVLHLGPIAIVADRRS